MTRMMIYHRRYLLCSRSDLPKADREASLRLDDDERSEEEEKRSVWREETAAKRQPSKDHTRSYGPITRLYVHIYAK